MNEPEGPLGGVPPTPPAPGNLSSQLLPALTSVLVLTLLTGCIFPLALAVPARLFFPGQAGGSLLRRDGSVIGSELIGQNFTKPEYFHPRPSAAGGGYDAAASGGTNLGLNNPKLENGAAGGTFTGVRELAEEYRRQNGLGTGAAIPIDAVTRSGSGLDPHITPANAALQVPRVARARGLREDVVHKLVEQCTEGPQLGFLGEARVRVLPLNLALDRASGRSGGTR